MHTPATIHDIFADRARRFGGRTAVTDGVRTLTYDELERRSNGIAGYLRRHGARAGDRVGLYSQRSTDAIAAMLAILKVGAAYVPFDPDYPPTLLQFMFADCAPSLLLAQRELLTASAPALWRGAAHDLGDIADEHAAVSPASAAVGPEDPAYIMYTSGSTGHPKGVLIPHRGVVRLAVGNDFAVMDADQVHLQLAPLAFDASTFEIWGALLNGAKLAVLAAPMPSLDDIAAAIAQHRVTTLWLTAGLFHMMVDNRLAGLKPLRQLLAGGDVLSPPHVTRAQAALPDCQLINGYGPTENTTFTCCYRIPRDLPPGPIPIGSPIGQTTVHILDEMLRPVPDGAAGELYTGGAGVALGYLNRGELTAERFVHSPFDSDGGRLYRTGDRARRRPDGIIEFLGRVDRQVKINGKRVELDEIEACIRRNPTVEDAAVTYPEVDRGPRRVHAYVTFKRGVGDIADLRNFLRRETADHMIPTTFTVMDALPLSPTGKIDRSQLPVPPHDRAVAAPAQASGADALEQTLHGIYCRALGAAHVGVEENFFDLGGTSLQLMQIHAAITALLPTDLTVVDLFRYPRISALAARLRTPPSGPDSGASRADRPLRPEERAQRQRAALARVRTSARRDSP